MERREGHAIEAHAAWATNPACWVGIVCAERHLKALSVRKTLHSKAGPHQALGNLCKPSRTRLPRGESEGETSRWSRAFRGRGLQNPVVRPLPETPALFEPSE